MIKNKRILLGITGGIAAYKSVYLLREFQKKGAEVRVIATPSALNFIGRHTLTSLTREEVPVHIFEENAPPSESWTRHIQWAEWADLFVIAPCTANTLGKIAHGLSDNMLTVTVLATRCPLLICPTMDGEMYNAPATQANLRIVRTLGYEVVEPEQGYLASGLEGKGRLPELNTILERINQILRRDSQKLSWLQDKTVVVTGGPTREYLDAVRYISNPSSGKMGLSMAKAAHFGGANVIFIHGPISLNIPAFIYSVEVESAQEMFEAVQNHKAADCFIMAAAVSDFRPARQSSKKIKKTQAQKTIKLVQNPDILQWLGEHKSKEQRIIGFAMETENLVENARKKLTQKKADWIAANTIGTHESGFATDYNKITLIGLDKQFDLQGTKNELAKQILSIAGNA